MENSMELEVPKNCKICGIESKNTLLDGRKGSGIYLTARFKWHIENEHNISIEQYYSEYENIELGKCPCQICGKDRTFLNPKSKNFKLKKYECGRTEGTMKWSKEAKTSRLGSNNPMHGKTPWNRGIGREDYRIDKIARLKEGKKVSKETRKKQSESAKKRSVHGHTGHRHSDETKEKLRQNTLKRISSGAYKQTKSKPHIEMCKILEDLNFRYSEEKVYGYYSFDIYLEEYDIYIEVDGDYFHANPKFYKNKILNETQKKNISNQKRKDSFCRTKNLKLLRFWEYDIENNKDNIICILQKLKE